MVAETNHAVHKPKQSWLRIWSSSLDTDQSSWHSSRPMTIILVLVVALSAGVFMRSRWALLLPLAIGGSVALAIAATGRSLGDTPIPFLVVVSTLVMVGGQGLRSQAIPPA
jgi:hypothetical protein